MVRDFSDGTQRDADHSATVHQGTDSRGAVAGITPTDPRHLRPVNDLLDLLREVTGVEVTHDTSNRRAPLAERFTLFHESNPHVYQALRTLAYQGLRAGRKRLSIAAMFERLRDVSIQTNGDPWLLDNSFKPFYVRLLEANEPPLRGLFETRRSVADEWIGGKAA